MLQTRTSADEYSTLSTGTYVISMFWTIGKTDALMSPEGEGGTQIFSRMCSPTVPDVFNAENLCTDTELWGGGGSRVNEERRYDDKIRSHDPCCGAGAAKRGASFAWSQSSITMLYS
jgi:hypothetical protein